MPIGDMGGLGGPMGGTALGIAPGIIGGWDGNTQYSSDS
jgi:hypothetical protein